LRKIYQKKKPKIILVGGKVRGGKVRRKHHACKGASKKRDGQQDSRFRARDSNGAKKKTDVGGEKRFETGGARREGNIGITTNAGMAKKKTRRGGEGKMRKRMAVIGRLRLKGKKKTVPQKKTKR